MSLVTSLFLLHFNKNEDITFVNTEDVQNLEFSELASGGTFI